MAKKKKKRPTESYRVQFRPGSKLGAAIEDLAGQENVSPGEMAKRLASMMVRHLPIEFYRPTAELAEVQGLGFDEAASQMAVHLELYQPMAKIPSASSKKHSQQRTQEIESLRIYADMLVSMWRNMLAAENRPIEVKILRT